MRQQFRLISIRFLRFDDRRNIQKQVLSKISHQAGLGWRIMETKSVG